MLMLPMRSRQLLIARWVEADYRLRRAASDLKGPCLIAAWIRSVFVFVMLNLLKPPCQRVRLLPFYKSNSTMGQEKNRCYET
jgi:hypothetical protein